jgi:hypothetical protein
MTRARFDRPSGGVPLRVCCAAVLLVAGAVFAAEPPAANPRGAAYDVEFARRFPQVSGAYQVSDWALYTALVQGDLYGYAVRIDPALAARFDQAAGMRSQRQRLQEEINRDKGLRATFDDHRRRIASMTLFATETASGGIAAGTGWCTSTRSSA